MRRRAVSNCDFRTSFVRTTPGRTIIGAVVVLVIAVIAAGATGARATDLPKSTQAVLQQLKLTPDILDGLDAELTVPPEWVVKAHASPTVKIAGSDDVPLYTAMIKPFRERYPFLKIDYYRGSANERVIKPLIAYQAGRYTADVVFSMDASTTNYAKDDISADLSDLPGYRNAMPGANPPGGLTAAFRARPYCLAYNTQLLRRDQLPKTWKDLVDTPVLAHGRIGAVMLPHLWMMPLWGKYGEAWALKYLDDYFTKLQPQIRHEGINATTALVGAGELYVSMPAYPERIKQMQDKGAPVAWYCPDMIPLNFSRLAVFRNSPGTWGGRIFVNWLLSKEGQLSQLAVFGTPPIHKDLQSPDFNVFPDEIRGKPFISFDDQAETDKFLAIWNKYALAGKGAR
jgi:ABC-type Fe3+ transport system substrate-binding protein